MDFASSGLLVKADKGKSDLINVCFRTILRTLGKSGQIGLFVSFNPSRKKVAKHHSVIDF